MLLCQFSQADRKIGGGQAPEFRAIDPQILLLNKAIWIKFQVAIFCLNLIKI